MSTIGAELDSVRPRMQPQTSVPSTIEPTTPEMSRPVQILFILSAIDIPLSLITMISAFSSAYFALGISLYAYGVQVLGHLVTSAVLALRLYPEFRLAREERERMQREIIGCEESLQLLAGRRRTDLQREQIAGISLCFIYCIMSVVFFYRSLMKFNRWEEWHLDHAKLEAQGKLATEALAWYGVAYYAIVSFARAALYPQVPMRFLQHVSVTSVMSFIFCLCLGASVTQPSRAAWVADAICGVVLSLALLVEGIRMGYFFLDDVDDLMKVNGKA